MYCIFQSLKRSRQRNDTISPTLEQSSNQHRYFARQTKDLLCTERFCPVHSRVPIDWVWKEYRYLKYLILFIYGYVQVTYLFGLPFQGPWFNPFSNIQSSHLLLLLSHSIQEDGKVSYSHSRPGQGDFIMEQMPQGIRVNTSQSTGDRSCSLLI